MTSKLPFSKVEIVKTEFKQDERPFSSINNNTTTTINLFNPTTTKPSCGGKYLGLIHQLLNHPNPQNHRPMNTPMCDYRVDPTTTFPASSLPPYCADTSIIRNLLNDAIQILQAEPALLDVEVTGPAEKVVIAGNLYGHFGDLIHRILREHEGDESNPCCKYLFLGGLVNRGAMSVEVMMLLLALKCEFPQNIFILRGMYDDAFFCRSQGFLKEVIRKFNRDDNTDEDGRIVPIALSVYDVFSDIFRWFPVAAVVTTSSSTSTSTSPHHHHHRRIFCCYSGLSPELLENSPNNNNGAKTGIEAIRNIKNREDYLTFMDQRESNIIACLFESLPSETVESWDNLIGRSSGYYFGSKITKEFCEKNDVELIINASEFNKEFEVKHDGRLITCSSAANYGGITECPGFVFEVSGDFELLVREYWDVSPKREEQEDNEEE